MSEAYKFNDPLDGANTMPPSYSRLSASRSTESVARQLRHCEAYTKSVLQRELKAIVDRAMGSSPAATWDDLKRTQLSVPLDAAHQPAASSWMQPSFQQFLEKAHAVRMGILVVRNVSAALREAAAQSRRGNVALHAMRARCVATEAVDRLRRLISAPPSLSDCQAAPTETQHLDLEASRRDLEAEMAEAGRKRFLGYLAMQRAQKVNGRRCSRARRFMAARPNRT